MHESKTIQLLNKYYDILSVDREPTTEELSFARYIDFDIARVIIDEFGEESALKIAKMIQAYIGFKELKEFDDILRSIHN